MTNDSSESAHGFKLQGMQSCVSPHVCVCACVRLTCENYNCYRIIVVGTNACHDEESKLTWQHLGESWSLS